MKNKEVTWQYRTSPTAVELWYYSQIMGWLFENHNEFGSGSEWRKEFTKFLRQLFCVSQMSEITLSTNNAGKLKKK